MGHFYGLKWASNLPGDQWFCLHSVSKIPIFFTYQVAKIGPVYEILVQIISQYYYAAKKLIKR